MRNNRSIVQAREGDILETVDRLIFDVKGLVHPLKRIIAFPRFIPDSRGSRKQKDTHYRKVYSLAERYTLLEKRLPKYLINDPVLGERLCEVPTSDIIRYYNPINHLQDLRDSSQLDDLEADALLFIESLQRHSNVSWSKLGISGSLLAHLHTPKSDIDPIVYGENNCLRVCEALKSAMKEDKGLVKAYTKGELLSLYNFRSQDTEMLFNDFVTSEHRKVLQGKFLQHDFYVRCVKDWNEIEECYGDVVYRRAGYAKITAKISDDSEAIFTPCRYSVDDVQVVEGESTEVVTEIASFRGRFCEQARKGETVIAQGKVEKVQKKDKDAYFRLLLGGKSSDFMALKR
jgi:predicted nucleotidyltransferase